MNYNFDEIVTRRGSNCIKWDEAEDPNIIPLWVADMDFHVYPGITEALRKRVEHDVFGYSLVPQTYYDAVIRWFRDRHGACGWQREHFITTIGVVPAISAISLPRNAKKSIMDFHSFTQPRTRAPGMPRMSFPVRYASLESLDRFR